MALTTFAGLKAAVADWLERTDLTSQIANDFFPMVQAKMYYGDAGQEPLRIRAMIASGTLTPNTSGEVTISTGVDSGWLAFTQITPTQAGAQSLNYLDPWEFRKRTDYLQSSVAPQYIYTIEGDTLYVAPKSVGTMTAVWYEKFAAVSGDSDTDWIILNAPQIYLNGCIAEACAFLDDEREAAFRAKFAGAISALNLNDRIARSSGATKVARPRSVV